MEKVKIMKLKKNAIIPKRATSGSAGADLYACIDEAVTVKPRELVKIPTGIAGVVDSDYRGEICVGLCNISENEYTIMPGERIAQMVIMPVAGAEFVETDVLGETERGVGGFGSSGKM